MSWPHFPFEAKFVLAPFPFVAPFPFGPISPIASPTIDGEVITIERLGAESYMYADIG